MRTEDYVIAKGLYEALCIPSDYLDHNGALRPFEYVVAIGDDVTSAIYAVNLARQINRIYGRYPTILCVGGQGILSRHLYKKSEAEVLADVCLKLGYPKDLIWAEGLETGKNTGENIHNIAKLLGANHLNRPSILFCVTKRQSLLVALTQRKQEPYFNAGWYVIEEPFEKACKLMNAKSLCGGEMMVHEVAAIFPRCQQYCGTYMEYPPFEITAIDFCADAAFLAKKYCLKLGGNPNYDMFDVSIGKFRLIDYCRYVRLRLSLMLNRKKIIAAIDHAIEEDNLEYGMTGANRF